MESKSYDVVLLPEENLSDLAISTSEDLAQYGTYFTLGRDKYFPHLSLYMLQLSQEGLSRTLELLKEIANNTNLLNVEIKHYHYSHHYLDVEYIKTEALGDIQNVVLDSLNPIRSGLRKKDEARLKTAEGDERTNILDFGYRSVGDMFAPHLTFTRFVENQSEIISELPKIESFNGSFNALAIFEMGDHGTCAKEVARFDLRRTS